LSETDQRSYAEKLIDALNHPEPETVIRAASFLATLHHKAAIGALLSRIESELLREKSDPYLLAALFRAIHDLGLPEIIFDRLLMRVDSRLVRRLLKEGHG
jgi:hypothetical protein